MSIDSEGGQEGSGGQKIEHYSQAESERRDQQAGSLTEKRTRRGSEKPRMTEIMLAEREAHEMDRAIQREEAKGPSKDEARERAYKRPEFRLTGEVREMLDDFVDAIEENRFEDAGSLINEIKFRKDVDLDDKDQLGTYFNDLIATHAKTLIGKKDNENFVGCVEQLGGYLSPEDIPEKLAPEIKMRIRDLAVKEFAKDYLGERDEKHDFPDTQEGTSVLGRLLSLDLLDKKTFGRMPEIQKNVDERLLASFENKSSDFGQLLTACKQLGITVKPKRATQEKIHRLALDWLGEEFEKLEKIKEGEDDDQHPKDPMHPLTLLSQLMDRYEYLGIELSAKQVRQRSSLLKQVQSALLESASYSDGSVDEEMDQMITDLRGKFEDNPNGWRSWNPFRRPMR